MSAKAADYVHRLTEFMTEQVLPPESEYYRYRADAGPSDHTVPPIVEQLKVLAQRRGLRNLFLPNISGLTDLEYAPLAEISGLRTIARVEISGPQSPLAAAVRS